MNYPADSMLRNSSFFASLLSRGCHLLAAALLALAALSQASSSFADAVVAAAATADSAATAPGKLSIANELAAKRKTLAEQIAKLTPEEDATISEARTEAAVDAEEELDLLRSLDLVYLQHQAAIEQKAELEQQKKRVQDELDSLHKFGPAEPKPYSFLLLEDLRDSLSAEADRKEALSTELAAAEQMLQSAREAFEECESERRAAREAVEENEDDEAKVKLAGDLRLAELGSTIAQAAVDLQRAEIELKTLRHGLGEARDTYLQEKVERISKDVRFTEKDYQSRLTELGKYREDFKRKLKRAEKLLHYHESQQLVMVGEAQKEQAAKALINVIVEAYQLARRVHQEEITQINQRLRELDHLKHFVNCRYAMASGTASKGDLEDWHDKLGETLDQLKQTRQSLAHRLEEVRVDQATLYRRLHVLTEQDEPQKEWIELESQQLERLVELGETNLLHLKSVQRSLERFYEDIEAVSESKSGPAWTETASEQFLTFWNYEFASVDDKPITVGKIASAIFYVLLGVVLARILSRIAGRHVLPRLGLNEGAINAVQSISFYSLCVLFSLLSLELVNLPFAAFTFLGGAVAIAFGFGSQNILNNFMSGLILLAEQPIRVGDLVEMEGVRGVVEHIGARSTRVKTMSNHEIIVPNSILLENKVTNLTLTDDLVQTAIGVSLSPTLPVDEVRRRLYEAAISHPSVLATPEPIVLFLEFSSTLLSFQLHFWIKLHSVMECRVVESEVREAISNSLRNTNAATKTVSPTILAVKADGRPMEETISVKLPDAPVLRQAS